MHQNQGRVTPAWSPLTPPPVQLLGLNYVRVIIGGCVVERVG